MQVCDPDFGKTMPQDISAPHEKIPRWQLPAVCIFLLLAVWIVFGQTVHFDFINYDDNAYVYSAPLVVHGLTGGGIARAFSGSFCGHWAPLTVLSHMAACQWFGLDAGAHHLINVLLHGAAAVLLFFVLLKMTGALWRSAFVAAVFAIHPLRVESVAWIAERKDVLSGVFFMLTLGAYVRYVRGPQTIARYLAVMLLFALGLMSKSMLVTLPFLLLVLDFYPLQRWSSGSARRLVLEKIPLFAISAAFSVVAVFADQKGIMPGDKFPIALRLGNALVACATYLWQMVFPARLAIFYPLQTGGLPLWQILTAALILVAISVAAFLARKKQPWFLAGWLWYLGMLVPVSGIIQAGSLARADRYTYLPQIGLSIIVAWGAADWCGFSRHRRAILAGIAVVVLPVLVLCARNQTAFWRDSETLWSHTIASTVPNALAHHSLGMALMKKERKDEALIHFREAARLRPDVADPNYNIGVIFLDKGQSDEAIRFFKKTLALQPDHANALGGLGSALLQKGDIDAAIATFRKALETKPDHADVHVNLGGALAQKGLWSEAAAHYQDAMRLDPAAALPVNNLAWLRATCPDAAQRSGAEAVRLAEQANRLEQNTPGTLDTLAAAYAEVGRFPDAIKTARQALKLATAQGDTTLTQSLRSELALYEAGKPFRETAPSLHP
jgi:protein O-mannosyl-transferase